MSPSLIRYEGRSTFLLLPRKCPCLTNCLASLRDSANPALNTVLSSLLSSICSRTSPVTPFVFAAFLNQPLHFVQTGPIYLANYVSLLHPSPFGRSAAIMRNRCNIFDCINL